MIRFLKVRLSWILCSIGKTRSGGWPPARQGGDPTPTGGVAGKFRSDQLESSRWWQDEMPKSDRQKLNKGIQDLLELDKSRFKLEKKEAIRHEEGVDRIVGASALMRKDIIQKFEFFMLIT